VGEDDSMTRGGFDAFVGNPPFLGGKRISTNLGDHYRVWLAGLHDDANGNVDLAGHFFRRAFDLLAPGGCLGLIATNTIAQGDTRVGGLRRIVDAGGTIYCVRRRIPWPGLALVVVSIVHVCKGRTPPGVEIVLDGRPVEAITSFLFYRGGDDPPQPISGRRLQAYIGTFLRGSGFLFADDDPAATPLCEMHRLLEDPRNRERVRPYLGGEEINFDPRHAHHRSAIDFSGLSEEQARAWPALIDIVERRVRPFRETLGDVGKNGHHKRYWWRFAEERQGLYRAIDGLSCVTAVARVTTHLGFVRLPADLLYSDQVVVFNSDSFAFFATLQSRVHEVWARFFSSTFGDGLRYAPSDCFDTFPRPDSVASGVTLDAAGRSYYEFRAAVMATSDEGLTRTYGRFNDPSEPSLKILRLRELHAQVDRAVLDAYGWTDIKPAYDFREQLDESVRLTWDDNARDEVLARLLELNRRIAECEPAEEAPNATQEVPKKTARKSNASKKSAQVSLGLEGDGET
jgi:hypothetical protein